MHKYLILNSKYVNTYYIVQMIAILYWINMLRRTNAHYIIYLFCAGFSFCSLGIKMARKKLERPAGHIIILAGVFATLIVLGNYDIIIVFTTAFTARLFTATMLYCSSIVVFFNIFDVAFVFFLQTKNKAIYTPSKKQKFLFF